MDDDDYRVLIEIVAEELARSGAPEIANERHYTWTNPDSGETKLVEPRKRLILMLEAFDRLVAVQDRGLLGKSLEAIQRVVRNEGPQRVVVALTDDDGGAREIELASAPDLAEVRDGISIVIRRLREDDVPFGDMEDGDER